VRDVLLAAAPGRRVILLRRGEPLGCGPAARNPHRHVRRDPGSGLLDGKTVFPGARVTQFNFEVSPIGFAYDDALIVARRVAAERRRDRT
jgi:hypothetical protein